MYAILIHLSGYALINALMPSWVGEAGWLVLSTWYGAFVAVDMIAIMFCRNYWLHWALAAYCAWSACLMVDVSSGGDLFQRHDQLMQAFLDIALAVTSLVTYLDWRSAHGARPAN